MAHQITYTEEQLNALKAKGAQYIVVARGDIAGHQRGQATSWHKSHDAAARKVGDSTWYTIYDITDAISSAML